MMFDKFNTDELSYHKIAGIRTLKIRNRYTRLNGKNSFRGEHGYGEDFLVKEIWTDQGARGWGYYPGNVASLDKNRDYLLIGKKVSELFLAEAGVTDDSVLDYDFPLHDLAGKILKVPVFRMMGSGGNNPVDCYDGAILMDDISPDENPGGMKKILEECEADYELGYRDFKLKIGRAPKWMDWKNGLKRDIEVTRMVREYYPNAKLMVDANSVYSLETMKLYVDAVADCHLYWIEEPFLEKMEDDLKLKEYLDMKSPGTMIADGEADPNVPDLIAMAQAGAVDVIQMDIAGYGFTRWRRLLPELIEKNIKISPHNWGLKVKTHYSASMAAAYSVVPTIEGVLDETEGVDFDGYMLKNGKITIPDKPGFGMDLIWGQEI